MDRRELLKAFAAFPGLTITPITVQDASEAALLILRAPGFIREAVAERLKSHIEHGLVGTKLEGIRVLVLCDGLQLEVIKSVPRGT